MSFHKSVLLFRDADPVIPAAAAPADPAPKDWGYRNENDEVIVDDKPVAVAPVEPVIPGAAAPAAPGEPAKVEPPTPAAPIEPAKPFEMTADAIKEAVKAADKYGMTKYDVLRAAGFDEFAVKMLEYRDKTGDMTPYLEAKTVDYTKMSPEQLLRRQLEKDNAGMSQKGLDIKFKKDFEDKYFLDRTVFPEGSDETLLGEEMLRLDSEKLKNQFIEEQNSFKAPEPKPDAEAAVRETAERERVTAISTEVMNNPATKAIKESKSLTFGKGEESFTIPIPNVEELIAQAKDAVSAKGIDFSKVNLKSLYISLAIANDPDKAINDALAQGMAHGHKKVQSELQNAGPDAPGPADGQPVLTGAQQLARGGHYTRN